MNYTTVKDEEIATEPIEVKSESVKCIVEDTRFMLNETHIILNNMCEFMYGDKTLPSIFDAEVTNSPCDEAKSMYDALLKIRESASYLREKANLIRDRLG